MHSNPTNCSFLAKLSEEHLDEFIRTSEYTILNQSDTIVLAQGGYIIAGELEVQSSE